MIQEMLFSFLEMQLKSANIDPTQVQQLFVRILAMVERVESMEKKLIAIENLLIEMETAHDNDSDNGRKQLAAVNG